MFFKQFKTKAYVHSLNKKAEVIIVEHIDNNHCKAIYNGLLCTAIFNPFVGSYYVDDKFGILQVLNDN